MAKTLGILENVKPKAEMPEEPKPSKSLDKILQDLVNEMFAFYAKCHKYHWNVTGQNFFDLHSMFGDMYENTWEAIDKTAEYIRILGSMADINVSTAPGNAKNDMQMVNDIIKANDALLTSLRAAEEASDYYDEEAIDNFLADRIDAHAKWAWQLKAFVSKGA